MGMAGGGIEPLGPIEYQGPVPQAFSGSGGRLGDISQPGTYAQQYTGSAPGAFQAFPGVMTPEQQAQQSAQQSQSPQNLYNSYANQVFGQQPGAYTPNFNPNLDISNMTYDELLKNGIEITGRYKRLSDYAPTQQGQPPQGIFLQPPTEAEQAQARESLYQNYLQQNPYQQSMGGTQDLYNQYAREVSGMNYQPGPLVSHLFITPPSYQDWLSQNKPTGPEMPGLPGGPPLLLSPGPPPPPITQPRPQPQPVARPQPTPNRQTQPIVARPPASLNRNTGQPQVRTAALPQQGTMMSTPRPPQRNVNPPLLTRPGPVRGR